jgi:DNA-directed RNA polymerase alpha subunit
MLRCAAYQEINAAARFLSRPANANHPLQKLATEAGIGIPRPKPTATASEAAIDMPICDVEISTRLANVLLNQGARTIADAIAITEESLLDIPNFGNKCLNEFRALRAEFSAG